VKRASINYKTLFFGGLMNNYQIKCPQQKKIGKLPTSEDEESFPLRLRRRNII